MAKNARQAALDAVTKWRRNGIWSDEAVDFSKSGGFADKRDAALASRIVYGTMQNLAFIDHYIGVYSSVPVKKLEPRVLDILRISAYQLLFMDRVPPSAAVSEGVSLCRANGFSKAAGLVNAVLRRLSEKRDRLPDIPGAGSAEYLATRYSHPLWLVREVMDAEGYAFAEDFLAANNAEPPVFAQVNTLKTTPGELEAQLSALGAEVNPGALSDSLRLRVPGSPADLAAFKAGMFYVQDEAARLAVITSGARSGMNVLDACAAPGGKSFAAAIQMENRGRIISCDLSAKKLPKISDNAARLGIDIIEARQMDARKPDRELHSWADLVLADVPCSGLGIIRKKPEIRYKTPGEIARLPEIQLAILEGLAPCVKPGGTLLYSTCTVLERENADVIGRFTEAHPEFAVEDMQSLWPHVQKTDGFFICRMLKSK